MTPRLPRVYNIASGGDFLDVLAHYILNGFPYESGAPRVALSRWTILLPTRRAAKQLGLTLLRATGQRAILLPQIRPIGDLDDAQALNQDAELPASISSTGQFFTILSLLDQWAKENPLIVLAQEIINSQTQAIALATSLVKLVDQIETEEVNLAKIGEAYEADLSEHRNAILSLLSIIRNELPKRLHEESLLSRPDHRNRALRGEAKRIAQGSQRYPIIAAGSTGTIPATRALLRAIAEHPCGAVILPGLDQYMDDQAWLSIKADHPQHSLKNLLEEFNLARSEVTNLGLGNENRSFLASELMRPTETADQWSTILIVNKTKITATIENLKMIEAPDRHLEARSIALILRGALEKSGQTAALVTPDRDLAGRVKAELKRWNIEIDDSAGEPLTHYGRAALTERIVEIFSSNFSPASILSLLNNPLCDLGLVRSDLIQTVNNLEIAVLRNYCVGDGLLGLQSAFERARLIFLSGKRAHTLTAKLDETQWQSMQGLINRIAGLANGVDPNKKLSFQKQFSIFLECVQKCAEGIRSDTAENDSFAEIMDEIAGEAHRLPPCTFQDAGAVILNILRNKTISRNVSTHPRLAIYGLLEARMMPCDILVLGGLNETKWPAQPDPGPWLNRPMRDIFGLQQPEREIGVSAHDFTQGLSYAQVYLTWSKRVDAAPLIPSRWILRLKAILQAAGLSLQELADHSWVEWAKALDEAEYLRPIEKPKPAPSLKARPIRISVTEVEKLIRDPYAVYARRVLKLEPLPPLARAADAALRGTLFHNAINEWNKLQPDALHKKNLEILLSAGERAFGPFLSDTEISAFWWPRFQKMARWLSNNEIDYRGGVKHVKTEISGSLEFVISGQQFTLYGTADRIDILENGQARILDYKTGAPPSSKQVTSGLSPQLPLEAAILKYGKFENLAQLEITSLDYVSVSGSKDSNEVTQIIPSDGLSIAELVDQKYADLKRLLTSYHNSTQAYLPRVAPFREEGELDYDHLSRFREWMLGGEKM